MRIQIPKIYFYMIFKWSYCNKLIEFYIKCQQEEIKKEIKKLSIIKFEMSATVKPHLASTN